MKGVRRLWEGLMRTVVWVRGIHIANFPFLSRLAIQWMDYSVLLAISLFFSKITERSAKAGDIEKNYQSLFFLLIPEWRREWKLVTENETFLMLSLAVKNHESDYAEACFVAWE